MARHCPKCHNVMDIGIIGETHIEKWHSLQHEGISENKGQQREYSIPDNKSGEIISAYRCENCGYIELGVEAQARDYEGVTPTANLS
jgi:rubrerythrin